MLRVFIAFLLVLLLTVQVMGEEVLQPEAQRLLEVINEYRVKNYVQPFKLCTETAAKCQEHSIKMTAQGCMSYPSGSKRMAICRSSTVRSCFTQWKRSKQNKRAMLCAEEYCGIGVSKRNGFLYFTLVAVDKEKKPSAVTTTQTYIVCPSEFISCER